MLVLTSQLARGKVIGNSCAVRIFNLHALKIYTLLAMRRRTSFRLALCEVETPLGRDLRAKWLSLNFTAGAGRSNLKP